MNSSTTSASTSASTSVSTSASDRLEKLQSKAFFDYEAGLMFNKRTGRLVGWLNKEGYIHINGKVYGFSYVHQAIYHSFHHTERLLPGWQIDHINHIRTDNRIENLRAIPKPKNNQLTNHRNKTSKYQGVFWEKHAKKWRSRYCHKHLGYFDTQEEAYDAYCNYKQKINKDF